MDKKTNTVPAEHADTQDFSGGSIAWSVHYSWDSIHEAKVVTGESQTRVRFETRRQVKSSASRRFFGLFCTSLQAVFPTTG